MDTLTPILLVCGLLSLGAAGMWMGLRAWGRTGPQAPPPPPIRERRTNQDKATKRRTEVRNVARQSNLIHMEAVRLSDQVSQYEEWRRHG